MCARANELALLTDGSPGLEGVEHIEMTDQPWIQPVGVKVHERQRLEISSGNKTSSFKCKYVTVC